MQHFEKNLCLPVCPCDDYATWKKSGTNTGRKGHIRDFRSLGKSGFSSNYFSSFQWIMVIDKKILAMNVVFLPHSTVHTTVGLREVWEPWISKSLVIRLCYLQKILQNLFIVEQSKQTDRWTLVEFLYNVFLLWRFLNCS